MIARAHARHFQRGVGLVEVSLAIVVGIVLASAAVIGVKKNRDRAITMELVAEEDLVFSAADAYFRASCRSGSLPTTVTPAALLAQGYLPRPARDPWGALWSVSYLNAPRRAQISASLPMAPLELVPWITARVGGYSYSGNTVSWVHNIRIAVDTTSASAMAFKAMYEPSNC